MKQQMIKGNFQISGLASFFILFMNFNSFALEYKNGDIIFQTSLSNQSLAIQRATKSIYSHMGIIIINNDKPFVFEAIEKVSITPLEKWINRGKNKHFVLKRVKNHDKLFTSSSISKLAESVTHFKGKPYDLTFEWSDDRIYCSELVWKIYKVVFNLQLCELQRLKDFNLNDPVVKAKVKERYRNSMPLNEPVVSPQSIFDSSLLQIVQDK